MFLPPVLSRARLHPCWPLLDDGLDMLDPQLLGVGRLQLVVSVDICRRCPNDPPAAGISTTTKASITFQRSSGFHGKWLKDFSLFLLLKQIADGTLMQMYDLCALYIGSTEHGVALVADRRNSIAQCIF